MEGLGDAQVEICEDDGFGAGSKFEMIDEVAEEARVPEAVGIGEVGDVFCFVVDLSTCAKEIKGHTHGSGPSAIRHPRLVGLTRCLYSSPVQRDCFIGVSLSRRCCFIVVVLMLVAEGQPKSPLEYVVSISFDSDAFASQQVAVDLVLDLLRQLEEEGR